MGESGRVVSDATPSALSSQFFCKPQTVLKLDCGTGVFQDMGMISQEMFFNEE